MTMRTYRHFLCENGHRGVEKTSENDQPYSSSWESVRTEGMIENGTDARGFVSYVCIQCRLPMTESKQA